jgi:ubiquinone/menaquinone biosynthesis C-methylase UbiE
VTENEALARHRRTTRMSFEKQAEDFSRSPLITDRDALARLVEWAAVAGPERVLDVACGPGLVAAALAPHVRMVIGIDLTPAMLARGVEIARERAVGNVIFVQGDVAELPFADRSFERIISRRAFHHVPDPARVLGEMARMCGPAGAVVIEDQALPTDPTAADAMTTIDRLRDPSHCCAVNPAAWPAMLEACGLTLERIDVQSRELDVDEWMARAHPDPGDAARAREMIEAAARGEIPGLRARSVGDNLHLTVGLQLLRAIPRTRVTAALGR